jgi:hypothetical protein
MAKKFKFCTPYNYVLNNPLRFYDIEGFAPGDLFTSTDLVAIDFGKYYNGQSILERREYGSQIYTVVKDNKTYYTYAEAAFGDVDEGAVDPRTAPSGSNVIGQMHTHANYTWWGTDRFSIGDPSWGSVGDIDIYNREKVLGYLVSPDGRITKYDPKTTKRTYLPLQDTENVIPSDPKDPNRKSKLDPTNLHSKAHPDDDNNTKTNKPNNTNWQVTISNWLQVNPNIKITFN